MIKYKNPGVIKFRAKINVDGNGSFVYFPFDVEELYGVKGRVPVKATFDGISYQGSMVKYGNPKHMLLILKSIREQLNKTDGDEINVIVELDDKKRSVDIPQVLQKELNKNTQLLEYFNKLAYTHKREYVKYIEDAKKEETRTRRVLRVIQMLKEKFEN